MKRQILHFTLLTLAALSPIYIIIGLYLYLDPFRVIHPDIPYYSIEKPMYVGSNKGFASTETFNANYEKEHYDSYILGTSLSIGYRVNDWKKHLPAHSKAFHFDASAETIDGIILKMEYILAKGEHINNALFILDPKIFGRENKKDAYLYIQHPDLTPEADCLQFHWKFFKVFLNSEFLSAYIDLKINRLQPYMIEGSIFNQDCPTYDGITNEESYPFYDKQIAENSDRFYSTRNIPFERKDNSEKIIPTYFDTTIKDKIIHIKKLLIAQNTSYKIIIPPLYTLIRLSDEDKSYLDNVFGKENIYDLSGKNKYSLDCHSFYDSYSHPRPEICKHILDEAYR
ncbi:MAG: hypothetical protein PHR45_05220 [Muribaculaceae bacterium]|nr:hypothetical protein [Muribaculaceae bacterium]